MTRPASRWPFRLALAVFALAAVSASADDEEEELKRKAGEAAVRVRALAEKVERLPRDEIDPEAAAIAANYELSEVSKLFKPRRRFGLGVGPIPNTVLPDGIELKLITLAALKAFTDDDLKRQRPALYEMAQHTVALAHVTAFYPRPKVKPSGWDKAVDESREASLAFLEAVRVGGPAAVQKAAARVSRNCNECHSAYRD
jgi:hypothetical protein